MKKQAVRFFAMATLLITLSVGSSIAHGFGLGVRANIPFDFVIGTKTLPRGTYTVKLLNTSPNVLVIRGRDNGEVALAISNTVSALDKEDNSPQLIFNRYGNEYFLSQVWRGASLAGKELPKSQQELEHLAKGSLEAEVVFIAAL